MSTAFHRPFYYRPLPFTVVITAFRCRFHCRFHCHFLIFRCLLMDEPGARTIEPRMGVLAVAAVRPE